MISRISRDVKGYQRISEISRDISDIKDIISEISINIRDIKDYRGSHGFEGI